MAVDRSSTQAGMTALAGGGQTGAPQIRPQVMASVTTVATIADSVMLPQAINGTEVRVVNAAANSMNVFPAPGDTINALAANAAFAVAGGKAVEFFCTSDGKFYSILSA